MKHKGQLESKWLFKGISIFLLKKKKKLFSRHGLEIGVISTFGWSLPQNSSLEKKSRELSKTPSYSY